LIVTMISEREKYEQFENYLKGLLDNEAKTAFENKLKRNAVLDREFEDYRQAHQLVFEGGLLDVRQELEMLHATQVKNIRIRRITRNILITAGILISASLLYFYLAHDNASKSPDLKVNLPETAREKISAMTGDKIKPERIPDATGTNKTNSKLKKDSTRVLISDMTRESLKGNYRVTENPSVDAIRKPFEPIPVTRALPAPILISADTAGIEDSILPDAEKSSLQKTSDCDKVKLFSEFITESTCLNAARGRILFLAQTVSGGDPPYSFSIDNGATFSQKAAFDNVRAGQYNLMIKDARDCFTFAGIANVQATECDFRFAPGLGEVWEIPFNTDKEGKLFIYSKDGRLIYSAAIGSLPDHTWNGESLSGEMLSLGVYMFRIEFKDGSIHNGTITIIK
jgi:hypothetical protein